MTEPTNETQATTAAQPVAPPVEPKPKKRLSSGPFGGEGVPFGSNHIRLNWRQWLATIAISLVVLWLLPVVWAMFEPIKLGDNPRVPFDLNNDYWYVSRYHAAEMADTNNVVVGDSVMWGAYVTPDKTLSAELSKRDGYSKFANLGISGCHPAVNYGLVKYYEKSLKNKNVLLFFNPLWISTPREDLTTKTLAPINHPKLLPQLVGVVPAYTEPLDDRIGIAIKHRLPVFGWVQHVQTVCFGGSDIPTWTVENPYGIPGYQNNPDLPADKNPDLDPSISTPWSKRIKPVEFPFVAPNKSIQWDYFGRLIELLQSRGNKVFVLVGPYNEHLMREKTAARYKTEIKPQMEEWLKAHNVAYIAPQPLPTELYKDSSHPILNGYALVADQLVANPEFQKMFK